MEENRHYRSRPRDFLRKQGFYIVLFLCLLIVGAAIVLTAFPGDTAETPSVQQTADPSLLLETRQSGDEPLKAKNTPLPTATPTLAPTPVPTPTPRPQSSGGTVKKGSAPVQGDVIWTFATDQLLYSRTLDQWTTHPGVDIAAETGTKVAAVLAGTVENVYEDDALGQVVTVAHTNGRISLYGNLDSAVSVKAGQKVNAGDVLGTVGTTALSECGDLPHLHLGFFVNGKAANPLDHVNIPH